MKIGDLIKFERSFRYHTAVIGLVININKQHVTVWRSNGTLKTWTIRERMEVISECS